MPPSEIRIWQANSGSGRAPAYRSASRKGTAAAALVSIVVGLAVRLVLFVMTPTMYGLDNTILYIPNGVFDATFDGWPTFIAFGASLITYVAIALLTSPAPIRGLDIRVAEDVDDALDEVNDAEPGVVRI